MRSAPFLKSIFILLIVSLTAKGQEYSIFKSFKETDEVHSIIVKQTNSHVLFIESDTAKTDTVKAWLSPFVSAGGGKALYPKLSSANGTSPKDSSYIMGFQAAFQLTHEKFDEDQKYDGYLVIKLKDKNPTRLKITLKRDSVPQNELLLTRSTISLEESNIWKLKGRGTLKFSTVLYVEDLESNIVLPKMRLLENSETPNYFSADDIEVRVKGHPTYEILNSGVDDTSTLPPKNQYTIEGEVRNVPLGANTVKLEFFAFNSQGTENPVLTLNVKKKSSIWGSLIILVMGIVFSFVTKKRVAIIKERIKIARKADQIINSFTARSRPYNLAFNRLTRIHKMVATISKLKHSDFAEQEKALETSQLIANYLKRTDLLYDQINAIPNGMQRRRATKHYNRIIERLADEDLTDADRIEKPLSELESWFDGGVFDATKYEADLLLDIQYFASKASVAEISRNGQAFTSQVQGLWNVMTVGTGKTPIERENCYATLKVLREWRDDEENFKKVIEAYLVDENVEDLFKVSDGLHWDRLMNNTPADKAPPLSFIRPANDVVEFEPLYFEVRPDEPEKGDNYLFKHGMKFKWSIQINDRKPYTITTEEPNVTYYSTETGKLNASVSGEFGKKKFPTPVKMREFKIKSSSSRSLLISTNSLERISIGAAIVLALISGTKAFYLTDTFVGTFQDYIGLFLWAAALELGAGALADLKSEAS